MTQGEGTEWLKCPYCSGMGVRVLGDEKHRLECIQCGRFRTYGAGSAETGPSSATAKSPAPVVDTPEIVVTPNQRSTE